MVLLKEIKEEKLFYQILNLQVEESQKNFVAPNAYSLAEAWFHERIARPFAIALQDGTPVGFCMGCVDVKKPYFGVWRLMVDRKHQGKGYGRRALKELVAYLKAEGAPEVFLSYEPENTVAAALYRSEGFVETGEVDDGELVAKLVL